MYVYSLLPLHKLQASHMITFEDQLSQVILSHCNYSLKAGHGADIKYDFPALEKHILDRFVRGKPLIDCVILAMSYRSEVIDAKCFLKIRDTIPQVHLYFYMYFFHFFISCKNYGTWR